MMNAVTEMPAPLVFSDSAANKVKQLIEEEGNPELKLRVFVTGGGCSGFQYGFTFDEVKNEDDAVMEKNGVHAADRPDELPVPGRRRDRLPGRPGRRAVRDQEPERPEHLRLRVVVLGLRLTHTQMKRGRSGAFFISTRAGQRDFAFFSRSRRATSGCGVARKAAQLLRREPASAAGMRDRQRIARLAGELNS